MIQVREWLAQILVWMPWLRDEQGVLLGLGAVTLALLSLVATLVLLRRRADRRRVSEPATVEPVAKPSEPAVSPEPPAPELKAESAPEAATVAPPVAPPPPVPVAPARPKPAEAPVEQGPEPVPPAPTAIEAPAEQPAPRPSWLNRVRAGLSKTRAGLADGLGNLFLGGKRLDDELLEELETRLLMADVGLDATRRILDGLTERLGRKEQVTPEAVMAALADDMIALLAPSAQPLDITVTSKPFVILVVGINGAGKTTTIGKLAHRFKAAGHSVMLAAGDTFRAAAVEQLQTWGARNDVPVVAQHTGADSASVIYDAVAAGQARGVDVVIADTAGRLHTQSNLMQELAKIKRVLAKLDPDAPHEVLLVVDGGTGQNALNQAQQFHQVVGLTGVAITKLDGTAKGGMLFAIAEKLGLPIRFIGVGEGIEDLQPFAAGDFVNALLGRDGSDGQD